MTHSLLSLSLSLAHTQTALAQRLAQLLAQNERSSLSSCSAAMSQLNHTINGSLPLWFYVPGYLHSTLEDTRAAVKRGCFGSLREQALAVIDGTVYVCVYACV